MKLPATFTILGHKVLVERVSGEFARTTKLGEGDTERGIIRVKTGMEPSVEDATILHEVIHFICDYLCVELDEQQVSALGQGLYQFLSDNNFDVRKK